MKTTWTLTTENVEKIINNLKQAWRKVDEHIAMIIFRKFYEGKQIEAEYMGTVCEMFKSDIWNYGAVS